MKQQIVGFYLINPKTKQFQVNDDGYLILCGNVENFPLPPDGFNFVPVTYSNLFYWIMIKKLNVCMDKQCFQNYSKEFYKMSVEIITNNAAELETMDDDELITVNFDVEKLNTDYQLI